MSKEGLLYTGIFWDLAILVTLGLVYAKNPQTLRERWFQIAAVLLFAHIAYREWESTQQSEELGEFEQPPMNLMAPEETVGATEEQGQEPVESFLDEPPTDISDYRQARHFGAVPKSTDTHYSPINFWAGAEGDPDNPRKGLHFTRGYDMAMIG
jgi:hypothetical protein